MSKNKKRNQKKSSFESSGPAESKDHAVAETIASSRADKPARFAYLKTRWWLICLILLLSLGVLGAGLKYLEEDAQKQKALPHREQSLLSKVNPFVPNPPPNPTPQLSKEYIYAGGKLLAVEDVSANAAPPSDLAIWRPGSGEWWILNGANSTQYYAFAWGTSIDNPQPGDFDGDGKTDFCIFRSTTNEWWIVKS